jgi:putative transposase
MTATTILRTVKIRLHPTPEQDARLRGWCGAVRAVYNAALAQRQWYGRAAGTDPHGRDCRFMSVRQARELKHARAEFPWLADCPAAALVNALRDLDKAFQSFFASRARYPTPRRRDENESITLPVFKVHNGMAKGYRVNVLFGRDCVTLPKIGRVVWVKHRKIKGAAKTATVIREGERWFLCVAVEIPIAPPKPASGAIGIDVGVAIPFMTSEGEALPFARTPPRLSAREKRLRRELSRCKRGSRRRHARRAKLSAITRRIAARRKAQMHGITTDIAQRFGVVAIEDLRVRNMTASAAGTVEQPGRNVAAKAGLNRSLLDVSPHLFRLLLIYKVESRGGTLVAVDPKNTSRTCPACGQVDAANRRTQADFRCVACGHQDNADANAARNILRAALASLSATVAGRRNAPSEPQERSATRKPSVSPLRAGQVTDRNVATATANRSRAAASPALVIDRNWGR